MNNLVVNQSKNTPVLGFCGSTAELVGKKQQTKENCTVFIQQNASG